MLLPAASIRTRKRRASTISEESLDLLLSFAEKAEREEDVEIAAVVVPTETIRELVQEVKMRRASAWKMCSESIPLRLDTCE